MDFWQSFAFLNIDHVVDLATEAENLGYTGVALGDHLAIPQDVSSPYPYSPDGIAAFDPATEFPDPWPLVAVMAAATTRLRFTTCVYIVPLRDPFSLAKSTATCALLSSNRVVLGAGVGWMKEEFDLVGRSFADRGRRTDEMLDVVAKIHRGGVIEHHGEFYDFGSITAAPAPTRPVPVWIGGQSPAALRRAARHEGWIGAPATADEVGAIVSALARARAEVNRAGEPFETVVILKDGRDLDPDAFRRLEDVGVTSVVLPALTYGVDETSYEFKRDRLADFADKVLREF